MSNYFDQFDEKKTSNYFDQFDSKSNSGQPETRGITGVASDLGVSFAGGANSLMELAGTLYGLTTGDMDNFARDQGARGREYWNSRKTPQLLQMEQDRTDKVNAAEGEIAKAGTAFWETLKSPSLLASYTFEQFPNLLLSGGSGVIARKGVETAAKYTGKKLSEKAAERAALGGAVGAGGAMQGSDAGGGAYDQLMALPDEVWLENPEVQRKLNGNMDLLPRIKREMAADLAADSAIASGIISIGINSLPVFRVLESRLAGIKMKPGASRLAEAGKGFIGETIGEGIEEGSGQLLSNLAESRIDPSQSLGEGVGEATGMGMAAGPMGAIGGGMGRSGGDTAGADTSRRIFEKPEEEKDDLDRELDKNQFSANQDNNSPIDPFNYTPPESPITPIEFAPLDLATSPDNQAFDRLNAEREAAKGRDYLSALSQKADQDISRATLENEQQQLLQQVSRESAPANPVMGNALLGAYLKQAPESAQALDTAQPIPAQTPQQEIATAQTEQGFLAMSDGNPFPSEEAARNSIPFKKNKGASIVPAPGGNGFVVQPIATQSAINNDAPVVLQNRDRATTASIEQMQKIAAKPDYSLAGFSRLFSDGAPVVEPGVNVPARNRGKSDTATTAEGRKIPVQYAVVEASTLVPSNKADGSRVPEYSQETAGKSRAIAGNGRVAGIQRAFEAGNAAEYVEEMAADEALHGISGDVIRSMKQPVLVRIMPKEEITANIGDESNTRTTAGLTPAEQAKTDERRVNVSGIAISEDGEISRASVTEFIASMPQSERAGLLDGGQPNRQAYDRINNLIFRQAFDSDALLRLQSEAVDPEVRTIMSALRIAAPKLARLRGTGVYDIRGLVEEAAETAVNAKRNGEKLNDFIQQTDMARNPEIEPILKMLAENIRSAKKIGEHLSALADLFYNESQRADADMFGPVQKRSRSELMGEMYGDQGRSENARDNGEQGRAEPNDAGAQRADPERSGADGIEQAQTVRPSRQNQEVDSPAFDLSSQTEAEIAVSESAATAAAKVESDRVAAADKVSADKNQADRTKANVDNMPLVLGQSPQEVNLSAQSGMSDIFSNPPEPDTKPADASPSTEPVKWFASEEKAVAWVDKQSNPANYRIENNSRRFEIFENEQAPDSAKPSSYGQGNKVFTAEDAEKARQTLRAKLNNLNAGLDPETFQAGLSLAGYHIEAGARSFAAYSKAMIDDMGDAVRPYLKQFYMAVKFDPRATDIEGMDSAATVEAADMQTLANTGNSANNESDTGSLGGQQNATDDKPGASTLDGVSSEEVRSPESTGGAGAVDSREIEDIAGEAASAAEMKAVASGNPLILEEFKLRADVAKLAGLKKSHDRKQFGITDSIKALERRIDYLPQSIAGARSDAKRLEDNPFGEPTKENPTGFAITIGDKKYSKREDAGKALVMDIAKFLKSNRPSLDGVGTYRGFSISLDRIGANVATMTLVGNREYELNLPAVEILAPAGMATRIQNVLGDIPAAEKKLTEALKTAKEDLAETRQAEGAPFKQEQELKQLKERHKAVLSELSKTDEDKAKEEEERSADGGAAKFSRNEDAAANIPIDRASAFISAITSRLDNAPETIVVQDMQDSRVPEAVRKEDAKKRSQGATGEPEGFYYQGKAYIVLDGLSKLRGESDAQALLRVFSHEVLGHAGLRGLFREDLNKVLNEVALKRRADLKRKAEEYGLDLTNSLDRLTAAEEVLAEMAQSEPSNSMVTKAIEAVRQALRKMFMMLPADIKKMLGGTEFATWLNSMTDAEIIDRFIVPARRFIQSSNNQEGSGYPVFQRAERSDQSFERSDKEKDSQSGEYVSWGLQSDPEFDDEGNESTGDEYALIEKIYVPPSQRGNGIARKMLRSALAEIKQEHPDLPIKIAALPFGEDAIEMEDLVSFYESEGFDVSNTDSDAVIMEFDGRIRASEKAKKQADQSSSTAQTDTPAFKKWFGDSKVVGANGEPMVVYHGTNGDFDEFKRVGRGGKIGMYFSPDANLSNVYGAGGSVMPVYLSIKNPKLIDSRTWWERARNKKLEYKDYSDRKGREGSSHISPQQLKQYQDQGYDGIINLDATEIIAFESTQIKSAIGNNGEFDPNNPSVLFSMGYAQEDSTGFSIPDETRTTRAIRVIQDKFKVLKDLQANIKESGGLVDEKNNAYIAEELFHGKAENDLRLMQDQYVEPLAEKMAKFDISREKLDKYLYARHAAERNAHIASINPKMPDGGSGMTNAQADVILDQVADSGQKEKYDQLAGIVDDMLQLQRDMIRQGGLQDDALTDAWQDQYEHYVPLKGFAEDTKGDGIPRTGKGFSIGGKESKRALGRSSEAASPTSYAIIDLTEKLIRRRKNEVGNSLLKLIQDNPNKDYWEVFSDENPDTDRRIKNVRDPATGEMVEQVTETTIPMAMLGDQYFTTKKSGKTYYMKLHDERLMKAMKNIGPESNNDIIRTMASINRVLSALNTSYSPEFLISNLSRDVQTAILNLQAEQSLPKGEGKASGEKIALQTVKDIPAAMKAIYASLNGKKLTGEGAQWQQAFDYFRQSGAKTGWFDSKDLDGQAANLDKMVEIAKGGFKGNSMRYMKYGAEFVENLNQAVENAVRLSAYVNAINAGISRQRAASLAKNMTVNFNRRGEVGTVLNSVYMFANASIQGSANFIRTMGTLKGDKSLKWENLNNAQRLAIGIAAGAYFMAMANRNSAGDDDDGENWYDKVPGYVKERNIVIMKSLLGGKQDGTYWKIPLPYGYNIFYVLGESAQSVVSGGQSAPQAATDLTLAALGSFSPIGFQDSETVTSGLMKNLAPTVLKPVVEIAVNENFFGSSIYDENYPFGTPKPNSTLGRRSTPEAYKNFSEWLNEISGGSDYRPGAIDVNPDVIQHFLDYFGGSAYSFFGSKLPDYVQKSAAGVTVEDSQTPFLSRISGRVMPYADTDKFYNRRDEIGQIFDEYRSLSASERLRYADRDKIKLELRGLLAETEKRLKFMRKKRNSIYTSDMPLKERDRRLKEVEGRMKTVVDTFNRAYNSIE